MSEKVDVLVIGAGLSGILFSTLAQKAGKKVVIIEKSKGLGGRLATRRVENIGVDHGIQWINHYPEIQSHLDEWLKKGLLLKSDNGFYTPQGMTSLAKKLAEDLTIIKGQRAFKISKENQWKIETEEGATFYATSVVITAPLPQAAELLTSTQAIPFAILDILKDYQYNKTLIGIFLVEHLSDEIKSFNHEGDQIIVMRDKSLHPAAILYVLSPEKSKRIYSNSDHECLAMIESEFQKITSNKLKITHRELKRWRYATPEKALPAVYLEPRNNLFLIGDSFIYPDIRGAILSAYGLAERLYPI
jgi:renalase